MSYSDDQDLRHPSHRTRISFEFTSYDEICMLCGAHDEGDHGWGDLRNPCTASNEDRIKYDIDHKIGAAPW
jgi:hypothetical protein